MALDAREVWCFGATSAYVRAAVTMFSGESSTSHIIPLHTA